LPNASGHFWRDTWGHLRGSFWKSGAAVRTGIPGLNFLIILLQGVKIKTVKKDGSKYPPTRRAVTGSIRSGFCDYLEIRVNSAMFHGDYDRSESFAHGRGETDRGLFYLGGLHVMVSCVVMLCVNILRVVILKKPLCRFKHMNKWRGRLL
jgi:hypothetical protein